MTKGFINQICNVASHRFNCFYRVRVMLSSTPAAFPASSVDSALRTCSLETYWKEENTLKEGTFELLFITGDKCVAEEGSTCSAIVLRGYSLCQ